MGSLEEIIRDTEKEFGLKLDSDMKMGKKSYYLHKTFFNFTKRFPKNWSTYIGRAIISDPLEKFN